MQFTVPKRDYSLYRMEVEKPTPLQRMVFDNLRNVQTRSYNQITGRYEENPGDGILR